MNHPQMSVLMSKQDADMLHFMTNLKVRRGTLMIVVIISFHKDKNKAYVEKLKSQFLSAGILPEQMVFKKEITAS